MAQLVVMYRKILRDLYVDDSTTSFNSFNQGVEFYTIAKKCLSNGGFDLRKWATDDPKLRDYISNHEQSLESSEISEMNQHMLKMNLVLVIIIGKC